MPVQMGRGFRHDRHEKGSRNSHMGGCGTPAHLTSTSLALQLQREQKSKLSSGNRWTCQRVVLVESSCTCCRQEARLLKKPGRRSPLGRVTLPGRVLMVLMSSSCELFRRLLARLCGARLREERGNKRGVHIAWLLSIPHHMRAVLAVKPSARDDRHSPLERLARLREYFGEELARGVAGGLEPTGPAGEAIHPTGRRVHSAGAERA